MWHFDAPTPKGHVVYSNSKNVNIFDMGRLSRRARKARGIAGPKTFIKYRDAAGRYRFKGSKYLKSTELLVLNLANTRHFVFLLSTYNPMHNIPRNPI